MSAAAPRTASTAPDLRSFGIAIGALILAVVLVAAVAVARPAAPSTPQAVAPAAPVVHDHGLSTAGSAPKGLVIEGTNGGGLQYMGIPYAPGRGLLIAGSNGGGLEYMGIPYAPPTVITYPSMDLYPGFNNRDGGRGTRFAQ